MKEEERTMKVVEQKIEVECTFMRSLLQQAANPFHLINCGESQFLQVATDQPRCSGTSTLIDLTEPMSPTSSDCDSLEALPQVSLVHSYWWNI